MTEQEFNRAAERHLDMVYRIALNWLKRPADAEDAAQNVMLRLWRTDAAFAGEDHLRHWLARVAVNECASLLRAPWRKRRAQLEEEALENLCFERPEDGCLWEALGELPPAQRALIHLRYYEGFSAAELAEQYHTTAQIISARLYRAKNQLKKRLEGLGNGTGLSQNV